MNEFAIDNLPGDASPRLRKLISARTRSASWRLFVYHDQGTIKGYSFLHAPKSIDWIDSLPTLPQQARLSSSFVEPDYRGQGVRGKILWHQFQYCMTENYKLWAVIEKSNTSSIRVAEKVGAVRSRTNYLIKIAGHNVFSILTEPNEFYALWSY
jgi:GNAT superfamily N-acetyltransferase